jgi:hypothetical protein
MKPNLDITPGAGRRNNGLNAIGGRRSRPSCSALATKTPNRNRPPDSVSDGTVWMYIVIQLLVTLAAGYLFWAKITSAWPF